MAARERGIRVISLEHFLRYLGFKPKGAKPVPDRDVPYRLKSKSAQAAVFGGR
jgi:hypothetical protein